MKHWFNMKIGQSEFLFLWRIFTDFVANIHFVHWCLLNCQFCIITFQCKMYFHFLRCFLPCILCWGRSVKTRNIILGKWCWWWSVDKYPWTWTIRQCDKTLDISSSSSDQPQDDTAIINTRQDAGSSWSPNTEQCHLSLSLMHASQPMKTSFAITL